jgi:probable HAF family extracellular repeat protein
MDLGTLGGYGSIADGVSADGSVVVGNSFNGSNTEAFRWTSSSGMVGLGILPPYSSSAARAASADGSVVAGEIRSVSTPGEAFRWTSGGGMIGLGDPVGLDSKRCHLADGQSSGGKKFRPGLNYRHWWTSGW